VGRLRGSLSDSDGETPQRTYRTKHGTMATMDTSHIGRPANRSAAETEGITRGHDQREGGAADEPEGAEYSARYVEGYAKGYTDAKAGKDPAIPIAPQKIVVGKVKRQGSLAASGETGPTDAEVSETAL
jgi:hypothetical protein